MKNKIIKYLIAFIISLGIGGLGFYLSYINNVGERSLVKNLTDGFTLPSITFISIYLIVLLSSKGVFDILGYSLKVVIYNTFRKNVKETSLEKSYEEYRLNKQERQTTSPIYLLVIGGVHLIGMIISLIIYYM